MTICLISGATGYSAKMKLILLAYHQPTIASRVYYSENNTSYVSLLSHLCFWKETWAQPNASIFDWLLFIFSKPKINFFQVRHFIVQQTSAALSDTKFLSSTADCTAHGQKGDPNFPQGLSHIVKTRHANSLGYYLPTWIGIHSSSDH